MNKIRVIDKGVIYDNPLPHLRSRHAYFPGVLQLLDGSLIASYIIGEAFESVDLTINIARSYDLGKTWEHIGEIYNKSQNDIPTSDILKLTYAGGNRLLAAGYEFIRENPELPLGNAKTGGVLADRVIYLTSDDLGKTWGIPQEIKTSFTTAVEASAPITVLKDGTWISPIANMPNWEGDIGEGFCGRLLKSTDEGKTWDDSTITMEFPKRTVTTYEQRLCQLKNSGTIVLIAWNEDVEKGTRMFNHYTLSHDNGVSFGAPKSTGIMGQASFVMALDNDKVLALHCLRRDTDKPGIYGYIVDLSKGNWNIEYETVLWEPSIPITKDNKFADIFSFLKFGQPSAIQLSDGSYLMSHWVIEAGQGKIIWTKFTVGDF